MKYWHSCGNTTLFQEQIAQLPGLRMYHCGPWSSFESAVRTMPKSVGIDLCANPQKDVVEADEATMRAQFKRIRREGKDASYAVRADAFMASGDYDPAIIDKIKRWARVAREELA